MATQNNPNIGFENFILIINNLLDKHAPFKEQAKRKEKLRFKHWVTKGILTSVKQRGKIHKEMIKAKNSQTKQLKLSFYKKYRNIIVDLPKQARKELEKHVPPTKRNFSNYLKNPFAKSFFLTPTTPEERFDLIQTLSLNKSTGPNSIPTSVLNKIKNEISIPLSAIINNSFENGIFPNLLKSAQVIPVFKNGSRLSCNNYRPISLLSNIGKIIEKLIHKRLNHFLEQHKVFYALQFGFHLNPSTNDALMSITENIQTHLDKKELTVQVFTDLGKAFDT